MTNPIQYGRYPQVKLTDNNRQSNSNLLAQEKGSVFSATIVKKQPGKITLLSEDDETFEVKEGSVKGNVGDKVYFEVLDNKDGLKLKQIFPNEDIKQDSLSNASIEELYEQSNLTKKDTNILAQPTEEELKEAQAIAKLRQELLFAVKNIRHSAVKTMLKEGISIDKISISLLTKAINEIEQRPSDAKIKKALDSIKQKIEDISDLDDDSVIKLVSEGKKISLDNIYTVKYSGKNSAEKIPDEEWKNLQKQLKALFNQEGIEYNKITEKFAKLMVENDIPITKENMDKAIDLSNIGKILDVDSFLETARILLILGENPNAIELINCNSANTAEYNEETDPKLQRADILNRAENIIEKLKSLGIEQIQAVLSQNKTLNLFNLINTPINEQNETPNKEYELIVAQRNLAEIQLKLTYEASIKLANKGIEIDVIPLTELVENLRNLEKEAYQRLFTNDNYSNVDTEENVTKITQLYDMLRLSQPLAPSVYGDIISRKTDFSVSGIFTAVTQALSQHETVVSQKYGDSFSKVKDKLKDFVSNLGLEPSEQNIKAATILSRNDIDVTAENIMEVKAIDSKIQAIYDRLHPNIAAAMIKDGLNPLEMHVDEVLGYIENFSEQYGTNLTDRIPELIAENNLDLSDDEKQSMMAIYRLLNIVKRNGSLSLGVGFKNNIDYTLGNMLEAAKNIKKFGQRDYVVDDEFGGLEELKTAANIRAALLKTASENADIAMSNIRRKGHPIVLSGMMKTTPDYKELPVDKLSQIIDNIYQEEQQNIERAEVERAIRLLNSSMPVSPEVLQQLEINTMPQTLLNLGIMQQYTNNPTALEDFLNGVEADDDILNEVPDGNLTQLLQGLSPDDIIENISDRLTQMQEDKPDLLMQIQLAQNAIKVSQFTTKQHIELDFSLPVKLSSGITTVNMHVVNGENLINGQAQILVDLNTKNLGKVQTLLSINNNEVSLTINVENNEDINTFKEYEGALTDFINETGFSVINIEYRS